MACSEAQAGSVLADAVCVCLCDVPICQGQGREEGGRGVRLAALPGWLRAIAPEPCHPTIVLRGCVWKNPDASSVSHCSVNDRAPVAWRRPKKKRSNAILNWILRNRISSQETLSKCAKKKLE